MLSAILPWVFSFLMSIFMSIPLYIAEEGEERFAKLMAFMILVFGCTIEVAMIVAVKAIEGAP